MKNYTITVNGIAYDVTVEEKGAAATAETPKMTTPVPAVSAPAAAEETAPAAAGTIEVKAGAAGKVFQIPTKVGDVLKAGDPVVIIEAMKMEIPVVAPEDGTVASIDSAVGDSIEAGDVLATLK